MLNKTEQAHDNTQTTQLLGFGYALLVLVYFTDSII